MKLLTGVVVAAPDVAVIVEFRQVERDVQFLDAIWERRIVLELKREAVKGPIPDRIRAALDKSVKLGAKGEKVTLAKALEVFKKDAGLDVPVREFGRVTAITTDGEELPVGAWFQLFADGNLDLRFLVREHGLLIAIKDQAPPDALGVVEFWKHKPTAAPESAPKK